jgi:hypothetical protein
MAMQPIKNSSYAAGKMKVSSKDCTEEKGSKKDVKKDKKMGA